LLLLTIFSSCSDDISNEKFRNENYVYYEENGKSGKWLKIDSNVKLIPPKSKSTYFFSNGSRFAELEVIDSFPNRKFKYYSKKDELIRTRIYKSDSILKDNFENGYYKGYHTNFGFLQSEGLVENNKVQGQWKFYQKDGKTLKQIIEYKNDSVNGIRKDFWENGNLQSISNWKMGKESGESIIYHENGNIDEKHFIKNGQIHGRIEQFYSDGTKRFWTNSWYGITKDTSKYFYKNGKLKNLTIVSLDTITKISIGKEYRYFPSGLIKAESEIKNNLPDGIKISYHENGNIREWMEIRQNKINGKFISYFKSGEKKREAIAKNNILVDNVYYYNKNGSILKTMIVEKGIIIDSIIH